MADREGARKNDIFLVVCKTPDVCKTPMGSAMVPVPYMIVAHLGQSTGVSPNVRFTGDPVFLLDKSKVPQVKGDEAGTGGGMRSGTHVNTCEPKKASSTVRSNKSNVVRHGDLFWMNNKNTDGTLVYLGACPAGCHARADGSTSKDTSPPVKPTEKEKGWLDKLNDWWEETKKEGRAAVKQPGQGAIGAGKDLVNTVPEIGTMIGRGEMLNSSASMHEAAAWNALFGNKEAAEQMTQVANAYNTGASSFELPKFDLSNMAQKGGAKISQAIQLATGIAGLFKRGALSMGKLAASESAAVKEVVQGEKMLATAAKGEKELAAVAKGEKELAAAAKGEKELAAAKKSEQAAAETTAQGEKSASKAPKKEAAGKEPEPGKDGVKVTKKPKSLREQYLGDTPSKKSATGKKVIERMKAEGTVREGPDGGLQFKASNGRWYPIEQADMAHRVDAVKWWNDTGRFYGVERGPEVRKWMLDPDNYVLDHYSLNRSAGAKLGIYYQPVVPKH